MPGQSDNTISKSDNVSAASWKNARNISNLTKRYAKDKAEIIVDPGSHKAIVSQACSDTAGMAGELLFWMCSKTTSMVMDGRQWIGSLWEIKSVVKCCGCAAYATRHRLSSL